MVRGKFKVTEIRRNMWSSGEVTTIKLCPVSGGSEENKRFWAASPSGSIELGCCNAVAVAQFELDGEYYVDFTRAE